MRLLGAKDIDVRVARVNSYGVALLLYKNARIDMQILDEEFGPLYWKRKHEQINGRLYCTIEIYNKEIGEWIAKQDVGTESFTEPEKGQASDSFKRSAVNVGIGRELYTAPDIWIDASKADIKEKNGKYYCNTRFKVNKIGYNDSREIIYLEICKDNGEVVFEYASKEPISKATNAILSESISTYAKLVKKKNADIIKYIMEKHCIDDMKTISEAYGYYLIKVVDRWIEKVSAEKEKKEEQESE